ncbi:hypothetical protein [Streptomyces sp. MH13]|uniref:hypothetical protein n=1 Tax=Streptomyces sp. MH13 TaxID=3417651 RepID=UPI003CE9B77C
MRQVGPDAHPPRGRAPSRARPTSPRTSASSSGARLSSARTANDGKLDEGAVLDPLTKERAGTNGRIAAAIDKAGDRPADLDTPEGTGGGDGADAGPAAGPRAVRGGLAEPGPGPGLWPAAAGGVLFAAGRALLIRSRRRPL